ncbi:MAG: hypothetical protein SX243_03305 [Acidobacteriota bacterium]|nr:hypothetical protein [Acidobacteriota bacterium]
MALLVTPALYSQTGAAGSEGRSDSQYFEFEGVNGLYSNPDPPINPVRQGNLTVTLRSPSNQVRLHSHRLRLVPLEGGTHGAFLDVEIEGQGDVVADLAVSGAVTQLDDEVEIPRQRLHLFGEIRLQREAEGYRVIAVELQPTVRVEVRSRLAGSLASTCRGFSRILPLAMDCDGLEQALARAAVPLPGPGETFLLPDRLLSDQDRRELDRYLGLSG